MAAGRFISFEGGEGAGKSTQISRLAARLREAGIDVVETREPGGSPGAEEIRNLLVTGEPDRWDPMTEALLLFAARRDHVERVIRPALGRGAWVLTDRFADSTIAYQGAAGGLRQSVVEELWRITIDRFAPDLTLILDLPVEKGLARAGIRIDGDDNGTDAKEDRFERKGLAFHETLRQAFLNLAAAEPSRCVVIDADKSPQEVHDRVWAAVASRLEADLG